jgi:small neutral amino acid transporter SnatA (MarC family)
VRITPILLRAILDCLAVALACLGLVLLLDVADFRWANQVSARLNEDRMLVIEKVFGFLIVAIGVQLVFDGLVWAGVITPMPH